MPVQTERAETTDRERSTVLRACSVLEVFRGKDQLSLATIAQETGLPKPTALRLVRRLVETGMLERTSGGYQIGLRLFELGQQAPRQEHLRRLSVSALEDLYDATHLFVHLGVRDGRDVVLVDTVGQRTAPGLDAQRGSRMPLYTTAMGKAILASSDPAVLHDALSSRLVPLTATTIKDPRRLAEEVLRARRDGIAYAHSESVQGLCCVGSAIVNSGGAVVGAISVGIWHRRTFDQSRVAASVRAAAAAVSAQVGSLPPGLI